LLSDRQPRPLPEHVLQRSGYFPVAVIRHTVPPSIMLICCPVSSRSDATKIRRWISELETLKTRHSSDPDAIRTIEICLQQATGWIGTRARAH
jgi:hypothetical protein